MQREQGNRRASTSAIGFSQRTLLSFCLALPKCERIKTIENTADSHGLHQEVGIVLAFLFGITGTAMWFSIINVGNVDGCIHIFKNKA